jgi:antitoxin HicB
MSKQDKRLEAIRRNPKNVRFRELCTVLEAHGFTGRPGKGDHSVFSHPLLIGNLSIDSRHPFLLLPYVKAALKAIDDADAASEEEEPE